MPGGEGQGRAFEPSSGRAQTVRSSERASTGRGGYPVGVEPLATCLLRLLPVFAPWALVLVGRAICLVAQRLPPAVRLVRAVRARRHDP